GCPVDQPALRAFVPVPVRRYPRVPYRCSLPPSALLPEPLDLRARWNSKPDRIHTAAIPRSRSQDPLLDRERPRQVQRWTFSLLTGLTGRAPNRNFYTCAYVSRAARSGIVMVDPWIETRCRTLKSLSVRVTVSRVVPMNSAISS